MEKITEYLIQRTVDDSKVRVWSENIAIPTYEVGEPEKNPIFLEKRVYQGSSGVVYPYPVIEKIADETIKMAFRILLAATTRARCERGE